MNFYGFHIGDYAAHTRHLTPIEDIAYRRMLDLYYTSESPLPLDLGRLARLIGMRDHMEAVEAVVDEFFDKTDDGYRSKRCDAEIAIYRQKIEQASRAGKASAQRRNGDRSTDVQRTFNAGSTDEQPTNPKNQSQEPIPDKTHTSAGADVLPDGLDAGAWEAFVTHRKQIKKKLTPKATEQQIKFLLQYDKPTQQAIVNESVRNGWTGLFAPKGGTHANTTDPAGRPASRVEIAGRTLRELRTGTAGQSKGRRDERVINPADCDAAPVQQHVPDA